MADLTKLDDDELDDLHMDVQERRAKADEKFREEALAIQAERDRRAAFKVIAELPDEVIAQIRKTKPAAKEA